MRLRWLILAPTLAALGTYGQGKAAADELAEPTMEVSDPRWWPQPDFMYEPEPIRSGAYLIAGGESRGEDYGWLVRFTVEVEDGLDIDVDEFAAQVEAVLYDARSWGPADRVHFGRISAGKPFLRVTLASPQTVDRECAPHRTRSFLSCWNGKRAMLNVDRWLSGSHRFGGELAEYRRYLVNHEVGHALGHPHEECPGPGQLAPVMMQQTKGVDRCVPSGWPDPTSVDQSTAIADADAPRAAGVTTASLAIAVALTHTGDDDADTARRNTDARAFYFPRDLYRELGDRIELSADAIRWVWERNAN